MKSRTFSRFAWAFVAYLLFVILFGAWVRITHSGAGCGSHWPTCHGEIIPIEPTVETMIEFTHRVTSGLLGVVGIGLLVGAWRAGRRVFVAACVTMALVVFEALIGAGIVLKELVADDASVARAIVIALHLGNTLLLTASAALVAWWSSERSTDVSVPSPRMFAAAVVGLVLIILTSMTGAVTALGDTLFPVDPTVGEGLMARLRDDLSSANHFLVRLRIVHPIVAVAAGLYLLVLGHAARIREEANLSMWGGALFGLVIVQLIVGVVNIGLAAPGWMQLLHLLFAQLVWIAAVMTAVTARGE